MSIQKILREHNYLLQIQEENRTAHQRGLLGEEELLVQKHPVLSKILKGKKQTTNPQCYHIAS